MLHFPSAFILVFALTFGSASTAETIQDYLKRSLHAEEIYQISEIEKTITEQEVRVASDLWTSALEFSHSGIDRDFTDSDEISGTYQQSEVSLSQSLPSGTDINFNYSQDTTVSSGIAVELETYQISLSQDLWSNAFGEADRKNRQRVRLLLDQQTHLTRLEKAKACVRSHSRFLETYTYQQIMDIESSRARQAQRVLDISTSSYRKKLIPKLDYLSAQSDQIESESRVLSAEQNVEVSQATLWTLIDPDLKQRPRLTDPLKAFQKLESERKAFRFENSLSYQAAIKNLDALQAQVESVRSQYKNPLTFSLQASHKDFTNLNLTDQVIQATLTFQWPFNNPTRDAEVRKAFDRHRQQKLQLRQTKKQVVEAHRQYESQLDKLRQRMDLVKKQLNLVKQQVGLALKRYENGRIEFVDYLQYRDQEVSLRSSYLQLGQQYWTSLISSLILTDQLEALCFQEPHS